jgi:hypothetical protein
MSAVPAILICTDAVKTDANLVWNATGRGPSTFSVPLVADDENATHETPATHWLAQDMSATAALAVTWLGMTNGDLPQISGVWGVDGVISAQDAMAACMGGNLQVYSAGGLIEGNAAIEWRNAILAGRGLIIRPDEPI